MSERCTRCGVEVRDGGRVYALCSGEFVEGEFVPDSEMDDGKWTAFDEDSSDMAYLCQECYEGMTG